MYRALFALAGFGIFGWLLIIFFPTWRLTRRLAESAVIPAFVSAVYLVGVVAVLRELGPGFMRDFGTADGVLGLLRIESIALVAWIHILAFDQVVAHLIYRDNMRYRFVPLPVQSVLLFVTLMLGPLGFLAYWGLRTTRARQLVGWDERLPAEQPERAAVRFADVVTERSLVRAALALWRRERGLVQLAALGFLLALIGAVMVAVSGSWIVEPAGRLRDAVRFDVALGIYLLTLALILPLAGFAEAERRRFVRWLVGLTLFSYGVENIQVWRGLDPRFTPAVIDQIIGGLFFLSALGIMTLFVHLVARFYREDTLPDHPALRIALRYAGATALLAFVVGLVMSAVRTRYIGAGNMMLIHAGGFHGLQAVPVVALLLGWSGLSAVQARLWTHVAGCAWALLCAGLTLQAFAGFAPLQQTPFLLIAVIGAAAWLVTMLYAMLISATARLAPEHAA